VNQIYNFGKILERVWKWEKFVDFLKHKTKAKAGYRVLKAVLIAIKTEQCGNGRSHILLSTNPKESQQYKIICI
jgi:hypothetical protein